MLDDNGTPFVTFSNTETQVDGSRDQDSSTSGNNDVVLGASSRRLSDTNNTIAVPSAVQSRCSHLCEQASRNVRNEYQNTFEAGNEDEDHLLRALPPQEVLEMVVDYFCTSFHHWIPYLHKAKTRSRVKDNDLGVDVAPILHALVAIVLPRLGEADLKMTHGQIHQQTRLSRNLALQYSVLNANLQSLQTLVLLIFEQVGRIPEKEHTVTGIHPALRCDV